jgi:hypothetical protein
MTVYCVSYDLRGKERPQYKSLIDELQRSSGWWHHLESTWLICTNESADQLYGRLWPHMHKDDSLLIIEVRDNCQGWLKARAWAWITASVPLPVTLPY